MKPGDLVRVKLLRWAIDERAEVIGILLSIQPMHPTQNTRVTVLTEGRVEGHVLSPLLLRKVEVLNENG